MHRRKQTSNTLKIDGLTDEIIEEYKLCYASNFNKPMQEYKELAEAKGNTPYMDYATGEIKDDYYIIPYKDDKDRLTYFTGEAVHRGEKLGNFEIKKYRNITGVNLPCFNERYLHQNEPYIFITERLI